VPRARAAPFIGVSDNSISGQLSGSPGMVSVCAATQHAPVALDSSTLGPVLALVRGLRAAWAATDPFRPPLPPAAPLRRPPLRPLPLSPPLPSPAAHPGGPRGQRGGQRWGS